MYKRITSIIIASIISLSALAQSQSGSDFLRFSNNDGAFFKREYYEVEKLHNVQFQVLVYTDLITNNRNGCLRIKATSTDSKEQYIGVIDYDELTGCVAKLKYLTETVMETVPEVYTEIDFNSKDRVKFGVFWDEKCKEWRFYINPEKAIRGTMTYITRHSAPLVVSAFEKALEILQRELFNQRLF